MPDKLTDFDKSELQETFYSPVGKVVISPNGGMLVISNRAKEFFQTGFSTEELIEIVELCKMADGIYDLLVKAGLGKSREVLMLTPPMSRLLGDRERSLKIMSDIVERMDKVFNMDIILPFNSMEINNAMIEYKTRLIAFLHGQL